MKFNRETISILWFCIPFTLAWLFLKAGFICYKYFENLVLLQNISIGLVFLSLPIGLISNAFLLKYHWMSIKDHSSTKSIHGIILIILSYIPMCVAQIVIYFLGLGVLFPKT